jgi:hypothetical protein
MAPCSPGRRDASASAPAEKGVAGPGDFSSSPTDAFKRCHPEERNRTFALRVCSRDEGSAFLFFVAPASSRHPARFCRCSTRRFLRVGPGGVSCLGAAPSGVEGAGFPCVAPHASPLSSRGRRGAGVPDTRRPGAKRHARKETACWGGGDRGRRGDCFCSLLYLVSRGSPSMRRHTPASLLRRKYLRLFPDRRGVL